MTTLEKQLEINKEKFKLLSPKEYSESTKRCIVRLGSSYRALGLWKDALRIFDIGYSLSQEANNEEGKSEFLIWKSNVYYHMGHYGRSIEFAAKAIGLGISDSTRVRYISYYLANPYLMLGDIERYISLQEKAIEISKKLSDKIDKEYIPWLLSYLAQGYDIVGDYAKANKIILEQVDKFRNLHQEYGLPLSLLILGKNLLHLNEFKKAKKALKESFEFYKKTKQEGFVVDILVELSKHSLNIDNLEEAKLYINRAIAEARKGPRETEGLADKRHLNQALIQCAKVYLYSKEIEKSFAFYEEALDLAVGSSRKSMIIELLKIKENLMSGG